VSSARWWALALLVATASGCGPDLGNPVAGFEVDADFDAVAPGRPLQFRTSWHYCQTEDPIFGDPVPVPDCDKVDYSARYRCLGVACDIATDSRTCGSSGPDQPDPVPCDDELVELTPLGEGMWTVEVALSGPDDHLLTSPEIPVVTATSVRIAQCGVDYEAGNCTYRAPSGGAGLEFRVVGDGDGHQIEVTATATSPNPDNPVTCRESNPTCLVEFLDPREPITVEARDGELTSSAVLSVPTFNGLPPW
jgi:hypothetical protein